MREAKPIDYELVSSVLRYEPSTGNLVWLSGRHKGKPAGKKVYRKVDGKPACILVRVGPNRYPAHRIAMVLMGRVLRSDEPVDHRNGDPFDNVWTNLRPATEQTNQWNRGCPRNNKSGFKGVFRSSRTDLKRPWIARIQLDGRQVHIGYFGSPQEASMAYEEVARKHRGEFAWQR